MSRPWMPLYVADYLADTGHLSTAEHGAYILLILHYWQNDGLPADEARLARIARMPAKEWARSRDTIAALFREGWRHKRIDAELAKAADIIGKRRAAAEQRYSKAAANADANAPPKADQMKTHAGARASVPQPQSHTPSSLRSDGPAAPAADPPGYPIDPTERLWTEGVDLLLGMEAHERQIRPMIGKWLRGARDDAGRVLDAIRLARDRGTRDPIALISRILQPDRRHDVPKPTVQDAAAALDLWARGELARETGAGGGARPPDVRLLSSR